MRLLRYYITLLACLTSDRLPAQVPTLTRVGEFGCSDCASAAQFATIPAFIGAFALAGRWLAADVESSDGTPRIVFWEVR